MSKPSISTSKPFIYLVQASDAAKLREDTAYLSYFCEVCGYQRYGRTLIYAVNICRACLWKVATKEQFRRHYCRDRAEDLWRRSWIPNGFFFPEITLTENAPD